MPTGRTAGAGTGRKVYAGGRGAVLAARAGLLWRSLLPSACALCGVVQHDVVCAECAAAVLARAWRCPRCALPCPRGQPCGRCPPDAAFDFALTLGDYATPQDSLVLSLKFGGTLPLAGWLAERLAVRMGPMRHMPDLIVPVPLSPDRLARRGFNQAWEIARPLARRLGVRADAALLSRVRETPAQSKLALADRHGNVRGAFRLVRTERSEQQQQEQPGRPGSLDGLHIGLVDDVMTSGATLHEAARVLKDHGARRVTAITALRTP